MNATPALQNLLRQQQRTLSLALPFNHSEFQTQFHRDLSPVGWHLGHTVFIEDFWLREGLRLKPQHGKSNPQHGKWLPENISKAERYIDLPPKNKLLDECRERQKQNCSLLEQSKSYKNHLFHRDYLIKFLAQHYAMHNETLCMIAVARALKTHDEIRAHQVSKVLKPAPIQHNNIICFNSKTYSIGNEDSWGFDNEGPCHQYHLNRFCLAKNAVTNAEFLHFIEHAGYSTRSYWTETGWRWLQKKNVNAPHHWRRDHNNHWFGIDVGGAYDLPASASVYGLNHYEALAFANYAGARLPHEFEWEAATPYIKHGRVWEWCANTFHPYQNFRPFPYKRYSQEWFDNRHYTLKGGSHHSADVLLRPAMRNFYTAGKRHIFAGLRLAL